jgi:hypothetical protein
MHTRCARARKDGSVMEMGGGGGGGEGRGGEGEVQERVG